MHVNSLNTPNLHRHSTRRFIQFHHHHHLFWKRPFLPRYATVRHLPIWSPSTHPWIPPIQDVNQALSCHYPHILSKSSFSSPYISPLAHPPFYRLIPSHPHSYAPDAQTTSICHASPHPPNSVHPEDCTNPNCISYPSATPRASISPSSVPSSPDYADLLSSSPRFQSICQYTLDTSLVYLSLNAVWCTPSCQDRRKLLELSPSTSHSGFAASSTPPAPSVSPK